MGLNIRAIEIGFGTTSFVQAVNQDNTPVIKTFSSTVSQVNSSVGQLDSGFAKRDTTQVKVGGNLYEIGPDAGLLSGKSTSRVLNNEYIHSEQYKALLFGTISMLDVNEVDILVLGLPVSNWSKRKELIELAEKKHIFKDREVNVKKVLVYVQPLGGLVNYSQHIGQQKFDELQGKNILSIDPGFGTFDWLFSRGLKINEARSGAVDFGMSYIINRVGDRLKELFPSFGQLSLDLIDEAFWKHKNFIRIAGIEYPFPKCEGKDMAGEAVSIKFDFTQDISVAVNQAVTELKNVVGNGADIDLINLMGGPASVYLTGINNAFPHHKIFVQPHAIQAVCTGLYFAGLFYAAQLTK